MVIWSEFRLGKYRDDDHREDTPHFIKGGASSRWPSIRPRVKFVQNDNWEDAPHFNIIISIWDLYIF